MNIDYAVTIRMGNEKRMLIVPDNQVKIFTNLLIDNEIIFECCTFCHKNEEQE